MIVKGPFRFSRHPMYLGMAAILLGAGFIFGSLVTFLVTVVFIITMEMVFISVEEKNMTEIFGENYINYKKHVRRWI